MKKSTAAFCLAVSLALVPACAASANDQPPAPETLTLPMSFSGFNADVAAENGYELRSNELGEQFVVPISNATGDFSGSTPLPAPVDENGNVVVNPHARGGITLNCGSSSIFFEGGVSGGPTPPPTLPGGTFDHIWRVTAVSAEGSREYNLDGLAPFGGAGWVSGEKAFDQPGTPTYIKVTMGIAFGRLGLACVSGGPDDAR